MDSVSPCHVQDRRGNVWAVEPERILRDVWHLHWWLLKHTRVEVWQFLVVLCEWWGVSKSTKEKDDPNTLSVPYMAVAEAARLLGCDLFSERPVRPILCNPSPGQCCQRGYGSLSP